MDDNPTEINVALIDVNPHQPRKDFDDVELSELAKSIKKHGVLQPLVVTKNKDHYELIAGERRLRASKLAGFRKVPVIVREANDHQKLELAIIENVHRSDLNPVDEALSYRKLMEEFGYTQEKVSEQVGKSRATIANKMRLLALSTEMKRALKEDKITEGHAKALLSIEDEGKRQALFEKIVSGNMNVRDAEKAARKASGKKSEPQERDDDNLVIDQLAEDLNTYLGTKVKIKRGRKGGKIEVQYYSIEELTRIYQKIKGIE
jgi:ParB family chromosome partitioning protein